MLNSFRKLQKLRLIVPVSNRYLPPRAMCEGVLTAASVPLGTSAAASSFRPALPQSIIELYTEQEKKTIKKLGKRPRRLYFEVDMNRFEPKDFQVSKYCFYLEFEGGHESLVVREHFRISKPSTGQSKTYRLLVAHSTSEDEIAEQWVIGKGEFIDGSSNVGLKRWNPRISNWRRKDVPAKRKSEVVRKDRGSAMLALSEVDKKADPLYKAALSDIVRNIAEQDDKRGRVAQSVPKAGNPYHPTFRGMSTAERKLNKASSAFGTGKAGLFPKGSSSDETEAEIECETAEYGGHEAEARDDCDGTSLRRTAPEPKNREPSKDGPAQLADNDDLDDVNDLSSYGSSLESVHAYGPMPSDKQKGRTVFKFVLGKHVYHTCCFSDCSSFDGHTDEVGKAMQLATGGVESHISGEIRNKVDRNVVKVSHARDFPWLHAAIRKAEFWKRAKSDRILVVKVYLLRSAVPAGPLASPVSSLKASSRKRKVQDSTDGSYEDSGASSYGDPDMSPSPEAEPVRNRRPRHKHARRGLGVQKTRPVPYKNLLSNPVKTAPSKSEAQRSASKQGTEAVQKRKSDLWKCIDRGVFRHRKKVLKRLHVCRRGW